MKMTVNEDFKRGMTTFEAGNTYDSEKQGIPETDLKRYHAAGWVEVEGWDKAPSRSTAGPVELSPDNAKHTLQSENIDG